MPGDHPTWFEGYQPQWRRWFHFGACLLEVGVMLLAPSLPVPGEYTATSEVWKQIPAWVFTSGQWQDILENLYT